MTVCPACGAGVAAAARFCAECGTALSRACPSCGVPVAAAQRFCSECGAALQSPDPAPAEPSATQPAPSAAHPQLVQAERRMCSVLFVDLVGFTPFTEARDAEDVRDLLSEYFARARTVIERYGGVVEKFIGDAVMAIWGTPVAVEGDAERAVRAGLDVVAAVAQLGAEVGAPGLRARAGVVTGDVAVTVGTVGEGVAGDTVNTAARVQSVAEPGAVWVDDVTARLTHAAIGYLDTGEHALKGKSEPMHLWSATRVLSMIGGVQRVDGLEAPMLGRDVELRTVKDLFHAAVERATARLVVVSGPPGVGKSRLGWEFEKYSDGLADSVLWHRGHCLSYGDGVAFWALAEAVRQRLAISEQDAPRVAGDKLAAGIADLFPDDADRRYVGIRLGRLLGVEYGADDDATLPREELFAGWRLFFERLASRAPVVLLFEDVHLSDAGLLDFVDHLTDWSRGVPIFVLAFARPELAEVAPGWGVGRNRTTITLDTLDETAMDQLVEALVPGMPEATRAAVANQAQGIPLYAVETIRSLIDRDLVVPQDGVYRLVGDVSDLTVPDTLRGLLAARFDALPAELHSLLSDAAVIGTSFPLSTLVAISGQDEHVVGPALDELVRREILDVSADPLSPQRGFYAFSQNLLRQVVYDTLSRRDRKQRHLAVATHLRSTYANDGDEIVEVVAQHYVDALSAAPADDDADAVRAEAIAALERAADRAERAGAPRRGAASLASAASLIDVGSVDGVLAAAQLWERAASDAELGALIDQSIEYSRNSARLYEQAGNSRAVARIQIAVARALRTSSRPAEARAELAPALEHLRDPVDSDTIRALCEFGSCACVEGHNDEAMDFVHEAIASAQAIGVGSELMAEVFAAGGLVYSIGNRFEQAVASLEHAIRLVEKTAQAADSIRAQIILSDLLLTADVDRALQVAVRARDNARRIGMQWAVSFATCNVASALVWRGRLDEAVAELAASREDGIDDEPAILQARALIAAIRGERDVLDALPPLPSVDGEDLQDAMYTAIVDVHVAAARHDSAACLQTARRHMERATVLGLRRETFAWTWTLGLRAAREMGDAAAVDEFLRLVDTQPLGYLSPLLRAERLLGHALLDASVPRVREAIAELRAVGSPFHLAHALLDLAELLRGSDPAAAQLAVDEAAALNEPLRAATLTRRLGGGVPVADGAVPLTVL